MVLRMFAEKEIDRCLFILADGSRPDVFTELINQGDLPNISRHLKERGSFVKGTTVFPSTTGPAFLPFLTGNFPGTLNIPGIRWLDRARQPVGPAFWRAVRSYVGLESYLLNKDIPRQVKTLFQLAGSSANIMSLVNRGSGFFGNKTIVLRAICWLYAHYTDNWLPVDRLAATITGRAIREKRKFIFSLFPAIDEMAHLSDPFSNKTIAAYLALDQQFGKIIKTLQAKGLYQKTAIFLFADHGLSQTNKHYELWQGLEKMGRQVLYHPKVFRRNCNAACMVSGNGMAHLYLADENGNYRSPLARERIEQLLPAVYQELLAEEAIELIASRRAGGGVDLQGKNGRALLKEENGKICYLPENNGDPLALGSEKLLLDKRQALLKTIETKYPDSLMQILQLFRAERCGDLVVSAKRGYDLRLLHEHPQHFSSHGSLDKEHMLIPIFSSLPLKDNAPLRSADIFNLALFQLTGREDLATDGQLLTD